MAVYPSPFGVLNEEGRFDDTTNDEIEAELRGLSLLDSILMTTEAWEKTACSITGHTLLVTKTDGYELRIDVVRTVESFLITGDHHLQVHILKGRNRSVGAVERVCIHHDMSYPNCAIADALISLVLLGNPIGHGGDTAHAPRIQSCCQAYANRSTIQARNHRIDARRP